MSHSARRSTSSNRGPEPARKDPRFRATALLTALLSAGAGPAWAADREYLEKASALNDSAVAKMRQGNFDGAEYDLLQAIEYAGGDVQKLRKNLGVVYYEKGVRALQQRKDFFEASRYLKQALDIDPQNTRYAKAYASTLFLEAKARAAQGLHDRALELYEAGTARDPSNLHVWVQAADYAWSIQRLDKAAAFLERARKIAPDDRNVKVLEERVRSARREESHSTETSEHFILSADAAQIAREGAHRVLYELEQTYAEVGYKLSVYPKRKITVVFYPLKDFHDHWRLPNRIDGYYDGKLRIPYSSKGLPEAVMKPIVRHELTHAFIAAASPHPVPRWLNEGIAQWVEGRQLDMKAKDALVIHQITRRLAPVAHLDKALGHQNNPFNNTEMTLAYMKALTLVEYLIEQGGIWKVMQLVQGSEPGDFEKVLKKNYGLDYNRLEADWQVWIERKRYNS
ncbi:MAG: hypothetical protein MOGMAGMI_00008 [Candidatus Omnitrophica bacterium]|nr:hypothetical protein [Candidatus Omnitrophota bacterium]